MISNNKAIDMEKRNKKTAYNRVDGPATKR